MWCISTSKCCSISLCWCVFKQLMNYVKKSVLQEHQWTHSSIPLLTEFLVRTTTNNEAESHFFSNLVFLTQFRFSFLMTDFWEAFVPFLFVGTYSCRSQSSLPGSLINYKWLRTYNAPIHAHRSARIVSIQCYVVLPDNFIGCHSIERIQDVWSQSAQSSESTC